MSVISPRASILRGLPVDREEHVEMMIDTSRPASTPQDRRRANATKPLLAALAFTTLTTSALAQGFPVPIPHPTEQPAYGPVKALIERGDRCAAELALRQDELWKARAATFLTMKERDDFFAEKQ